MKKTFLICLISIFALGLNAQEDRKNLISLSTVRMESNSQNLYQSIHFKVITGIGYERVVGKWSFGAKYEHGLNRQIQSCKLCYDAYTGLAHIREDNFYLTSHYDFLDLSHSKVIPGAGMSFYYSNLNFYGDFTGGLSGVGAQVNRVFNTFGLSPNLDLKYYPAPYLFVSMSLSGRIGLGTYTSPQNKTPLEKYELVFTAPELRVGLRF